MTPDDSQMWDRMEALLTVSSRSSQKPEHCRHPKKNCRDVARTLQLPSLSSVSSQQTLDLTSVDWSTGGPDCWLDHVNTPALMARQAYWTSQVCRCW